MSFFRKQLCAFLFSSSVIWSDAPHFFSFLDDEEGKITKKELPTEKLKVDPLRNDRDLVAQNAPETTPPPAQAQAQTPEPTAIIPGNREPGATNFILTPDSERQTPYDPQSGLLQTPIKQQETIRVNLNNVSMVELLRYVSQISGKNFIFNEADIPFTVSIISEEDTTIENILTATLQELRIRDLDVIEQGNNLIVNPNPKIKSIGKVITDSKPELVKTKDTEFVTKVFRLNTLEPDKAQAVAIPLLSEQAIVETVENPNHLIVTDLSQNVNKLTELIRALDAPEGGLVIGQYVVKNLQVDSIVSVIADIMRPMAKEQPLHFVAHPKGDAVFIISSPFLVEKALSMMNYIDQPEGVTQVHELNGQVAGQKPNGRWVLDDNGNWVFKPEKGLQGTDGGPPEGTWQIDGNGNLVFIPKGEERAELRRPQANPEGTWVKDADGRWNFQLTPGQSISPGRLSRRREYEELPAGDIERTQFFIRKLQYRKGNEIIDALSKIAASLQGCGQINEDLICAINSGQWIESSNSMIFTGAPTALGKIKELIEEVDAPVRQVFIEMLILETDITDSLRFAVNWESSFGGGDSVGAQAFLSPTSPLTNVFNNTVTLPPSVTNVVKDQGYTMGIIGQSISHCGVTFRTLGALVKAVHTISNSKVLMNPKIIVEDQQEAEIFVGINTSYQTNSIANDRGNTITSNYEYRDIGTTLRITPSIGNNGLVTLDIYQESSNVISNGNGGSGSSGSGVSGSSSIGGGNTSGQNNNSGPTTRVNKTITRVHIPNRYFLVISGMMQDDNTLTRIQIPCLGGVPLLGALFSDRTRQDQRQNLMIFIRPEIVDTVDEMQNLTKHQQDIFQKRSRVKQSWKYETEEALDFLNVPEVCRPWCADPDRPN